MAAGAITAQAGEYCPNESEVVLSYPADVAFARHMRYVLIGGQGIEKIFPKCSRSTLFSSNAFPGSFTQVRRGYPLYLRSTESTEQVSAPGRLDLTARLTGPFLSQCAVLFQEKRDEFYPLVVRSTEICRKSVGPDHPQVGTMLAFHADVLRWQVRAARIVHELVVWALNRG